MGKRRKYSRTRKYRKAGSNTPISLSPGSKRTMRSIKTSVQGQISKDRSNITVNKTRLRNNLRAILELRKQIKAKHIKDPIVKETMQFKARQLDRDKILRQRIELYTRSHRNNQHTVGLIDRYTRKQSHQSRVNIKNLMSKKYNK